MKDVENRILRLFTRTVQSLNRIIESFEYKDEQLGNTVFIIDFLFYHPECSMSDISENLGLSPSTATRQIDRLEEWGLVSRQLSKEDRRKMVINLTTEGKEAFGQFYDLRMANIRKVLGQMTDREVSILEKLLSSVIGQLHPMAEE